MNVHSAEQKVAIVTGGAGAGIGRGITMTLLDAGWRVLVVDLDQRACDEMRAALGVGIRDAVGVLVTPVGPNSYANPRVRLSTAPFRDGDDLELA